MNPQNLSAINLLSHQLAHHPHLFAEKIPNPSVMKEARGEQMTIFYNGQVIVFNDVPAEKAKDVMSFVTNLGTSKTITTSAASNGQVLFPFPGKIIPATSIAAPQLPSTPVIYDLPMTRKASLYRFLEKRKDRNAARGPYQANNAIANLDKPIEESMSWLALAPQSPQVKSESSSTSVLF